MTSLRRKPSSRPRAGSYLGSHHDAHEASLTAIRQFLKGRTCYDAFPISFRLIVLDTKLSVKKALPCLLMNSQSSLLLPLPLPHLFLCQASSPLLSGTATNLPLLACSPSSISSISSSTTTRQITPWPMPPKTSNTSVSSLSEVCFPFNLRSCAHPFPDIEKELGVPPPPLLSRHPFHTLFDAAKTLIQTHARRLPLLDYDTETGHEVIVSTLTQYRLLKFISINVRSLLPSSFFMPYFFLIQVPQRMPEPTHSSPQTRYWHLRLSVSAHFANRLWKLQYFPSHRHRLHEHTRFRRRPYLLRALRFRCTHHRRGWHRCQPL
jgi:hypothetical protein